MIIDFHTHIFSPDIKNNRDKYITSDPLFASLYSNPKAKLATADDLISIMDEQEIDKSVVLNISWSTHELCLESNDYIMQSISRYPDRLIGFGMITFNSPDLAIQELERCIKAGMKGIGEIRPHVQLLNDVGIFKPIVKYMEETRLIMLTHGSEPVGHIYPGKGDLTPEALYPFISAFPDLKLVCAHWGGGLPFYSLMPEVKKMLANVYFDSAASPFLYRPEIYTCVSSLAGNDKILFGTDYPLLAPRRLLDEIETLSLPKDIKNKVLYENACQLLEIGKR